MNSPCRELSNGGLESGVTLLVRWEIIFCQLAFDVQSSCILTDTAWRLPSLYSPSSSSPCCLSSSGRYFILIFTTYLRVLIPLFFVRNKSLDCIVLFDVDCQNGLLQPRTWFFTRNRATVVPPCSSP